ncbi:MAG: DUF177 domain-containing protein [Actinobacteria bacterium]|nr:DUF177 domain-containing protein [Actinomycetota bacterium]
MQPIIISVFPALGEPGDSLSLQGKLDEKNYTVGFDTYEILDGITYDVTLYNSGHAIILSGTVTASVRGECSRCLEPADFEIESQAEGYYLFDESAAEEQGLEEDEFEIVTSDETIDISNAIMVALTIETPLVLFCKKNCKGLCPRCGVDLNYESCSCDKEVVDPTNPFAALAGMFPWPSEEPSAEDR